MTKMKLVVFGTDYNRYPSGIQHICDHYLPENEIIWVETIGMRSPSFNVYDIKRSIEKIVGWIFRSRAKSKTKLPKGLSILNPVLVPYSQYKWIRRLNLRLVKRSLSAELRRRQFVDYTNIYTSPSDYDFVGELGEAASLYYCIDEFSLWPGMNQALIKQLDHNLTKKADLVVVSSDALYAAKSSFAKKTYLLTHGVDFEHFSRSIRETGLSNNSSEQANPSKVFKMAYFGLFDERTDQSLLLDLVKHVPNCEIEIIGDVVTNIDKLQKEKRINWRGRVSYDLLPKEVAEIDLFLLPYHLSELARNINPLKIKEYMATGKPCIATPLPEVEKFSDAIYVAKNNKHFVQLAQNIRDGRLVYNNQKATEIAAGESWQSKSDIFAQLLNQLNPSLGQTV